MSKQGGRTSPSPAAHPAPVLSSVFNKPKGLDSTLELQSFGLRNYTRLPLSLESKPGMSASISDPLISISLSDQFG